MVFVALDLAAFALQRQRGLDYVPQGLSAGFTCGGEVEENGQKLMALVVDEFLPACRGRCGLRAVFHSPVCHTELHYVIRTNKIKFFISIYLLSPLKAFIINVVIIY